MLFYYQVIIIPVRQNIEMNINKIRETFESFGYKGNSQINQTKLNEILESLMSSKSHQPYDKDVADELWEQASGGSNFIEINRICETIDDGINILQSKLEEINEQIRILEREKNETNRASNGPNRNMLAKLEKDIANLQQDRDEFEEDLLLVTLPFGINVMGRGSLRFGGDNRSSRVGGGAGAGGDSTVIEGVPGDQNEQLKFILYFSIAYGIIEIIIIYAKFDFLNLMVVTCLLSIYLLNHFDNLYIKLSLILLGVSEVLDIIWLFMYASQKWNPPTVGNDTSYQVEYLRFIVFFTVVIIALKIPIGYYLYRIKNINDNKYVISMGMFKVILNANKSNPITRNLNSVLNPNVNT